jgi:hypothetical protein
MARWARAGEPLKPSHLLRATVGLSTPMRATTLVGSCGEGESSSSPRDLAREVFAEDHPDDNAVAYRGEVSVPVFLDLDPVR